MRACSAGSAAASGRLVPSGAHPGRAGGYAARRQGREHHLGRIPAQRLVGRVGPGGIGPADQLERGAGADRAPRSASSRLERGGHPRRPCRGPRRPSAAEPTSNSTRRASMSLLQRGQVGRHLGRRRRSGPARPRRAGSAARRAVAATHGSGAEPAQPKRVAGQRERHRGRRRETLSRPGQHQLGLEREVGLPALLDFSGVHGHAGEERRRGRERAGRGARRSSSGRRPARPASARFRAPTPAGHRPLPALLRSHPEPRAGRRRPARHRRPRGARPGPAAVPLAGRWRRPWRDTPPAAGGQARTECASPSKSVSGPANWRWTRLERVLQLARAACPGPGRGPPPRSPPAGPAPPSRSARRR